MSPLRRTRERRPQGVPRAVATRLTVSALVLIAALVMVRASATATAQGSGSEVCVPPVPVGGSCTSTSSSSSTSTRSTSQTTSTLSGSTTGTQTETTTSTSTSTTGAGDTTSTATSTSTPTPSGSRSSAAPTPSPASHFPPPPPPLPPPSPGSAAAAPETIVQRIVMVPASAGPIAPGDTVEVQVTLEAQRGTEIFAVPHVPVTFTLVAVSGDGAAVTPARVSSGDSGVALARVRTGDQPGDTVVSAGSGTASAQLAIHTDLPGTGAAATRVGSPSTGGATPASQGGHGLALTGLLVVVGMLGAVALGVVRRPRLG